MRTHNQFALLLCSILFFFGPAIAQQVTDDGCTNYKNTSGQIDYSSFPQACWRITPFVGTSRRPLSMKISFPVFSLGDNTLEIYTSTNADPSQLYGSFYGDEALVNGHAVINTAVLFLYLKGESMCEFSFTFESGEKTELKTAIVVLISVVIMLAIPFICIRIAMCTQTKKIKHMQLQQPQFGTRRRLVALWAGLALGLLIMVLLLSRQIEM